MARSQLYLKLVAAGAEFLARSPIGDDDIALCVPSVVPNYSAKLTRGSKLECRMIAAGRLSQCPVEPDARSDGQLNR
jgi:hypothetical protein